MSENRLSQERLKEVLSYNPETGIFTWNKRVSTNVNIGDVAGNTNSTGYIRISIENCSYRAHRLAWLYMKGEWPNEIDHINHDRADNKLCNLRSVDRKGNTQNTSMLKTNTSGVIGVYWDRRDKIWKAHIGVDSKQVNLGRFKDKESAITARKNAELKYGFHPNHGS